MNEGTKAGIKVALFLLPPVALLIWHDWKTAAIAAGVIAGMAVYAIVLDRLF